MKVKSVCGELTREQLGTVTPHEHVMLDLTAFYQALPVPGIEDPATQKVEMWNLGILSRDCYALKDNLLLMDEEVQAEELARFRDAGGDTVVDATLPGIGRDPEALRRISEKTGLNIIMGTGFYVGETHPKELATMTDCEVADIMVKELTEGVDGTDICAGYIGEIGISEIFDDKERKVLRAAALAQKDTGVAIQVHINPWTTNGLEAADILLNAGVSPDRIEVLVHRESIMHSAIEYIDNSVIAQMSVPDMRLCVQYALTHPVRTEAVIPPLDLTMVGKMTFAHPDVETFTLLRLALDAIRTGGAVPAVLNAANEVAVGAFLDKKLDFVGIFDLVEETVNALPDAARIYSLEDIYAFDGAARSLANEFLAKRSTLG